MSQVAWFCKPLLFEQENNNPPSVPVRGLTGWGANSSTSTNQGQGYYPELTTDQWKNFKDPYSAAAYAKKLNPMSKPQIIQAKKKKQLQSL